MLELAGTPEFVELPPISRVYWKQRSQIMNQSWRYGVARNPDQTHNIYFAVINDNGGFVSTKHHRYEWPTIRVILGIAFCLGVQWVLIERIFWSHLIEITNRVYCVSLFSFRLENVGDIIKQAVTVAVSCMLLYYIADVLVYLSLDNVFCPTCNSEEDPHNTRSNITHMFAALCDE